jgi:hypothetical protein
MGTEAWAFHEEGAMKRLPILILLGLISTGSGGCQGIPVPETRIGINVPPGGEVRTFSWDPVPSASAYQLVVTIDRNGTQPIGMTGFTSDTQISASAIAWRQGHPVVGRPYFWTVRAYDRPDPQGVLLTVRGPQEIKFTAGDLPQAWPSDLPSVQPTAQPSGQPSAVPASGAPASSSPAPSFAPAQKKEAASPRPPGIQLTADSESKLTDASRRTCGHPTARAP